MTAKILFAFVIIVSCAPALAQDDDSNWSWQIVRPSSLSNMVDDLVWLYDRYKAKCYSDSTEIFADSGGVRHTCLVLGCEQIWDVPPKKIHAGWRHSKPTFDGFIEWVRKK